MHVQRRQVAPGSDMVRVGRCVVLDHQMDDSALPCLIDNQLHSDPSVHSRALYALRCDRCKEGASRPKTRLSRSRSCCMTQTRICDNGRPGRWVNACPGTPAVLAPLLIVHVRDRQAMRKIAR
jgi:hypothetical protein